MANRRCDFTWHLTPEQIAGIFVTNGWVYADGKPPEPKDIRSLIENVVLRLRRSNARYEELGRFVIYKDIEFPDSYEVLMRVAYMTEYPDDLDKVTSG